jgi:Icc-related predicted phosphoesterase
MVTISLGARTVGRLRIFFTTDVHGSERCFLKFVNAGKFYDANVLILGGDISGKLIIPIVDRQGAYECELESSRLTASSQQELDVLQKRIRDAGFYPYVASKEIVEDLRANPQQQDALFSRLMCESVANWIAIAQERLRGTGIQCLISPGNDDRFEIDQVIPRSGFVMNPEGEVFIIEGGYEVITLGFSNMTPWNCPRDIQENDLADKIQALMAKVTRFETCIFNMHCPPYNSGLDLAPQLDEKLTPILAPGGSPMMIPVGSPSVRSAIEKHQPLLGLHGHIHESRATAKIGRTLCINPGSEYSEGILRGAVVDIKDHIVDDFLLTAG